MIPFELNKVHCCDCLEALKQLPDKCVDLVLTDPPYDYESWGGSNAPEYFGHVMQKSEIASIINGYNIPLFLSQIERVMRRFNAYIFCSTKQLPELLTGGYSRGLSVTLLIWHKYNSIPYANNVWRQDAEAVVHLRESGATFQGSSLEKCRVYVAPSNPREFGHPTEKPIELIKRYVGISSNTGDLILDPFMGSGTTGVAAVQLGRQFLGFEIDPEYCRLANDRIEAARKGLKLNEYRQGQQTLFQ